METKKAQAREVSCSVRVQTDDHSGTNKGHAHAVEKSSRTCNRTLACACDRNRPCVRRKEKRRGSPSKTVELGGFVFCLGLPAFIFLVFLEQRCSLKNRRASISSFRLLSCQFPLFPHPTQKHEKFDVPLWNFVALSSASFNVMPLWSCSQQMHQTSLWSANFEWRKSVFEELDHERWTLTFPAPKDEYNVRHNVRKRGGEESKTIW